MQDTAHAAQAALARVQRMHTAPGEPDSPQDYYYSDREGDDDDADEEELPMYP